MADNEVLVVASKVKTYIKSQGDMKTSASVLSALSDKIRAMCDGAIESARSDGRKTVLDRDFS
jgi:histone H3/H4